MLLPIIATLLVFNIIFLLSIVGHLVQFRKEIMGYMAVIVDNDTKEEFLKNLEIVKKTIKEND